MDDYTHEQHEMLLKALDEYAGNRWQILAEARYNELKED